MANKQTERYIVVCRVPHETLSICKVNGSQLLTKEVAEAAAKKYNATTSMSKFTVHPVTVDLS